MLDVFRTNHCLLDGKMAKEVKQLQLSAMAGVVNGCCVGSLLMFVFLVSIIVTDFAYSVIVRRQGSKEIVASVVYIVVCIDRFGY